MIELFNKDNPAFRRDLDAFVEETIKKYLEKNNVNEEYNVNEKDFVNKEYNVGEE